MSRTLLELEKKRRAARAMGDPQKLRKLRDSGRLNARERLDLLLDPGSFVEIGLLGRSQQPELTARTPADGLIAGSGTIDGRPVYVTSEDATVLAGTRGRVAEAKTKRIRDLALRHRHPYLALTEAGAGRFQENGGALAADAGYRFFEHFRLSGRVPQVAAIFGASFGGPSFTAIQSDFVSIVAGNGFMGMSGPPLVKVGLGKSVTNEEIGSAEKCARHTGQADHLAETERDCLLAIREFLSFFPSNCWEAPPRLAPAPAPLDEAEGRRKICELVSENHRRAYDMNRVLPLVVDRGHLLHYRPLYGANLITAWGRVRGDSVGFVANNPQHLAGAVDHKAAIKLRKFVDICDAFHIPLVFLADCPGFIVGPEIEDRRMISLTGRLLNSVLGATVPKTTIILRKAIGLAYIALGGRATFPEAIYAWPTARFDPMGPAAGVELVHGRAIAQAADPDALRAELLAQAEEKASAYRAAEMASIDDVIHPAETREVIARALDRARASCTPAFKHRIDP
ncbi:MAG: acyl-CoA carboxylase subunit beta [Reyranellaceae bacterium]